MKTNAEMFKELDEFIDSLSTQEYYALKDAGHLKGFDNRISTWDKICFGADNVFSSACTLYVNPITYININIKLKNNCI